MVMVLKHLNVKAIVLDRTLLWAYMDAALSQGPLLWLHKTRPLLYVVCISVSLDFPYMVSVFPCFPHMVRLLKHLNVMAIVLDRPLIWAPMDTALSQGLYCDVTRIRPLLFHVIRADLSSSPGAAILDRRSINYFYFSFQSDLVYNSMK